MNVWIVNPFDNLPSEGNRPQRYWLMARAFLRAGHSVVYWTSDFSHARKAKRREIRDLDEADRGVRVVQIPTLPYAKNICLARALSHRRLARDFERLADEQTDGRAQVIIASAPPLGLCEAARRVAGRQGALFVADIQDAWPETFERILPRFVWSLLGLRRAARRIYRSADGVSAVSRRYLELARDSGSTAPMHLAGHAIGLGKVEGRGEGQGGGEGQGQGWRLRLVYAGNMSLSYDLETLIKAVLGMVDVTLDVAGNGPDMWPLRLMLDRECRGVDEELQIQFHGYLGERDLAALLRSCDVGIVPMFPESCVGVPGKLADYAAAGLQVIESLGGECQEIVEKYGVGMHYRAGDVESLAHAIRVMRRRHEESDRSDAAGFRDAFDAEKVMGGYVNWVEGLADRK